MPLTVLPSAGTSCALLCSPRTTLVVIWLVSTTYIHTYIHTYRLCLTIMYIHTYIHTHTHKHTHTHTHTHIQLHMDTYYSSYHWYTSSHVVICIYTDIQCTFIENTQSTTVPYSRKGKSSTKEIKFYFVFVAINPHH